MIAAAAALAEQGRTTAHALCTITDEQLVAVTGDAADAEMVLPWLDSAVPAGERGRLLTAAVRSLIAQGAMAPEGVAAALEGREPEGDPEAPVPGALLLGVVSRRVLSPVSLTVAAEASPAALQLHLDRDGTILVEQVSEAGLHHFHMSPRDEARKAVLAHLLAPGSIEHFASAASTTVIGTASRDEIRARSDVREQVSAEARSRTLEILDRRDHGRERVHIVPGRDGVLVMQELESDGSRGPHGDSPVEAALVGRAGLEDLVDAALSSV